jgi:cell wall-associated NlpC family hydrolase
MRRLAPRRNVQHPPVLRPALAGLAMLAACCAPAAHAAPRPAPAAASAPADAPRDAELMRIIARAQQQPTPPTAAVAPQAGPGGEASSWWRQQDVVHEVSSRTSQLVINALSFLGVRYRYGGDHAARGFDCSGLVRRVYQETLGLVLPHNAAEQSREGEKVAENELRPGDLVFFNTLRRAFSHVGIYIGNGQFVHAPRPGEKVQIANLDSPYWARRFDGARRLITRAADPLVSSAQAASLREQAVGAQAAGKTLPAAALPISNAVPDGASPATAALMAGAVLPRPPSADVSRP